MTADLRLQAFGAVLALGLCGVWLASVVVLGNETALLFPALATAACIGAWLLFAAARGDHRVLLGFLAFSTIALSIQFRNRAQGTASLDLQNGLKVAAWLGMLAISALNWRATLRLCADPAVLAWMCFAVVCVLSAAYSPVPVLTAMSAISALAYLGFACLLVQAAPASSIWLTLIWSLAAYLVINDLSPLFAPANVTFLGDRFQGVAGHPNSLGRQAALFLIAVFAGYYRRDITWRWFAALLTLGAGTLLWTQSRTPLISFALAGMCLVRRSLVLPLLLGLVLVGAIVWLTGCIDTLFDQVGREGDAGDALTMAGRTELWQFVLGQIRQQPLIGHGYNSFETVATPLYDGQHSAAVETHNNYLEALFSVGVLGFVPFMAGVSIALYRWIRQPYPPRDLFVLTLVVGSFTEADITSIAVLPTMLFFAVVAMDGARRIDDRTGALHAWT